MGEGEYDYLLKNTNFHRIYVKEDKRWYTDERKEKLMQMDIYGNNYCTEDELRKIIDGYAVVLYENDQIYFNELKKAKVDLDEFLMQCRIAGYFNLNELQTVVLESNGRFSFFPKERYRPLVVEDMQIKVNKVNLPTLLVKKDIFILII